jgi:adenine-specific DNA-methyltransferase
MADRLPDNEIRDITRTLEAGLPLEEKYRYLLFKESRQVELLWNGKSDKQSAPVLPFQTVEHIDEPRDVSRTNMQVSLFDMDGSKIYGWSNKLIWGDNKFVLSSLQSGPVRDQIIANGGIKLIYIDPPFDIGADFTTNIEIGSSTFEKTPTVLEEIAFRDTWGNGQDSFLQMLYERLVLMKDLLAPDGSIFVHLGQQVSNEVKIILDELFGKENFRNQITWQRFGSHNDSNRYGNVSEVIYFYSKSESYYFDVERTPLDDDYISERFIKEAETGRLFYPHTFTGAGAGPARTFRGKLMEPPKGRHWARTQEEIDKAEAANLFYYTANGVPYIKSYLDEQEGKPVQNIWTDIRMTKSGDERTGYPTQKPERLIERIIKAHSQPGDIVADFFVGSGTTAAVAEKLGRKWLVSDVGRFAINTSRKRLISVQRQLKREGKDYRSFEVLTIGSYSFNDDRSQREFNELVINAYGGQIVQNSVFAGKKGASVVAVGPYDLPCSKDFVDAMVEECRKNGITSMDVLAFEFGLGVAPDAQEEALTKGVKLVLKYIPREVFDKRAISSGAVKFADVGFLDIKIKKKGKEITVELIDFSVHYSQNTVQSLSDSLGKGKTSIVLEDGILKKISKSKDGIVKIQEITTKWADWIDYWAIDFNYADREELVLRTSADGELEQTATGRYVFDNEWQSFKTNNDDLELISAPRTYAEKGTYKVAVKVVDVFGNDTTKVFEVEVG